MNKPLKVEFAPGCFDNFDGTQEELDGLMAEIQSTFAGMTPEELERQSRLVDLDEALENDPELIAAMQQISGMDKRTLQ
jgi:hypothetical protein